MNRLGCFRLLFSFVGRSCLQLLWWNGCTSASMDTLRGSVGIMASSTPIGYNFYIFSLTRRISLYPTKSQHISYPSEKSRRRKDGGGIARLAEFSYMVTGHRVLSDKPLENSLPHDSSPDILYLLVLGQDRIGGRRHEDAPPPSVSPETPTSGIRPPMAFTPVGSRSAYTCPQVSPAPFIVERPRLPIYV